MAFPSSVTGFARATFPIPFVPSGHFPLTRGIGPLGGGRLNPFPRNRSRPFGVPLIRPLRGHLPPGEGLASCHCEERSDVAIRPVC